mmetsp:Transcript_11496/g.16179  ORF Transcript_11496/g.16179 Transcript_11496/m.16179 type:complete len:292 (+) Transcript_11496:756-1631(+)
MRSWYSSSSSFKSAALASAARRISLSVVASFSSEATSVATASLILRSTFEASSSALARSCAFSSRSRASSSLAECSPPLFFSFAIKLFKETLARSASRSDMSKRSFSTIRCSNSFLSDSNSSAWNLVRTARSSSNALMRYSSVARLVASASRISSMVSVKNLTSALAAMTSCSHTEACKRDEAALSATSFSVARAEATSWRAFSKAFRSSSISLRSMLWTFSAALKVNFFESAREIVGKSTERSDFNCSASSSAESRALCSSWNALRSTSILLRMPSSSTRSASIAVSVAF